MTLRIDIHRFLRVALAIALASAVVGLACLLPAAAMAAPSHGMDQPAKGCDTSGSIGVCPHESKTVAVATSALADHTDLTFAMLPAGVLGTTPTLVSAAPVPVSVSPPDTGTPLSAPLRL